MLLSLLMSNESTPPFLLCMLLRRWNMMEANRVTSVHLQRPMWVGNIVIVSPSIFV